MLNRVTLSIIPVFAQVFAQVVIVVAALAICETARNSREDTDGRCVAEVKPRFCGFLQTNASVIGKYRKTSF
jgi:hypothetical protein